MDPLSLLLENIHLQGAVFQYAQASAPWALRLQTPGLAAFHIVTVGSCWLMVDGTEPLALHAGDIAILPGGRRHRLQHSCDNDDSNLEATDLLPLLNADAKKVLRFGNPQAPAETGTDLLSGNFRFDVELAKPLIHALPAVIHVPAENGRPAPWLEVGLQFVATEMSGDRPARQAIINRIAEILLMECLRYYIEALPEGSGNWLLALRDASLSAALAAMHSRPEKNWNVPELAKIACMSRSAFASRFKTIVGQPPQSYLTEHRMRLAAWQLTHTRQPIWNIAEQLGYGSDSAFAQAFRRAHAISPSSFRKQTQFQT